MIDAGQVKLCDNTRYYALTSIVLYEHDGVVNAPLSIKSVLRNVLPREQRFRLQDIEKIVSNLESDVTPERVYETIWAYVNSSEYDIDGDVLSLWEGGLVGWSLQSEADMALMKQLYYLCKADVRLMVACFRSFDRMRSEWDDKRGEQTYREFTIAKMRKSNSNVFGGDYL
mgnify:CR=1 FL=1